MLVLTRTGCLTRVVARRASTVVRFIVKELMGNYCSEIVRSHGS